MGRLAHPKELFLNDYLDLAVEYIEDLESSGVTEMRRVKDAVQEWLVLDDEEFEEVWERWQDTRRKR